MTVNAQVGTVIIRRDLLLPLGTKLPSEAYCRNWNSIKPADARGIENLLQLAGWCFFFMAGEVTGLAFGAGSPGSVRRAVLRIVSKVQHTSFNAVEVTAIRARRFVGVPYIRVSAHSRHLQEGRFLESDGDRRHTKRDADRAGD